MKMEVISHNLYKTLEKDYLPSTIKRWVELLLELAREGIGLKGFGRMSEYLAYYESFCNTQLYSEIVERKDLDKQHLYYEALYRVLNELEGIIRVALYEYGNEGVESPLIKQLPEAVKDYESRYNMTSRTHVQ